MGIMETKSGSNNEKKIEKRMKSNLIGVCFWAMMNNLLLLVILCCMWSMLLTMGVYDVLKDLKANWVFLFYFFLFHFQFMDNLILIVGSIRRNTQYTKYWLAQVMVFKLPFLVFLTIILAWTAYLIDLNFEGDMHFATKEANVSKIFTSYISFREFLGMKINSVTWAAIYLGDCTASLIWTMHYVRSLNNLMQESHCPIMV